MTTLDDFYDTLRCILGDEQVHGIWNYPDDKLDSAVKSVFLLGRGPVGYTFDKDAETISPDVKAGDPFALVCYDACKLLIGGEDGEVRIATRELTIDDAGHRKRDLLIELGELIYQIRDGSAVFDTRQDFESFVYALRPGWMLGRTGVSVVSGPSDISI